MSKLPNIHPGEILLEEFLKPLALSQNKIAKSIGVPPRRINEICLGKRSISVDTALRLGKYLGTSELFWLNLQNMYDIEKTKSEISQDLRIIKPLISNNNKEGTIENFS
jgi:addiction module HigA family antidote